MAFTLKAQGIIIILCVLVISQSSIGVLYPIPFRPNGEHNTLQSIMIIFWSYNAIVAKTHINSLSPSSRRGALLGKILN